MVHPRVSGGRLSALRTGLPVLSQRSMYGLEAFEIHGVLKGMVLTGWRVLRCNPFSHGGVDHVPGSAREARSQMLHDADAGMRGERP